MAASSAKRTTQPCKMLALLLISTLFTAGVLAQEDEIEKATAPSVDLGAVVRGDMVPATTESQDTQVQVIVLPTPGPLPETEQPTTASTDETEKDKSSTPAAPEEVQTAAAANTEKPKDEGTPAPMPGRGDGPDVPRPVPNDDIVCVTKEAVQEKNAVSLKLKTTSNCADTKQKIESVVQELCGEDCKLEIYQEDNTDEILVSGKYVEEDVAGMANKFNNDNIKDKVDVEEAVPRWGKNSKLVLVALLLAGLLLAALLVAGYYFKTHRKNSKGVRLAESFQVDEENQANTLVSVAPLPQEPVDKPTTNGESAPENGSSQAPTTNGHSQTPVADTEM